MGNIINSLIQWCNSIIGKGVLFAITIMTIRVLLTYLREKYGKKSQFYKNIKALMFLLCGIFFFGIVSSCINGLIAKIGGFIPKISKIIPWSLATTMLYAAIAAIISFRARTKLSLRPFWIVWVTVAANVVIAQINTQDIFRQNITGQAILVGIVFTILTCILSLLIDCSIEKQIKAEAEATKAKEQQIAQNATEATKNFTHLASEDNPRKNTANKKKHSKVTKREILWIISIIAAYIAGEFSLLPKLIRFLKRHFSQQSSNAKDVHNDIVDSEGSILSTR